jgi:hypothetical protein
MNLHINFPKNLVTASMVTQKNIPCICRVSSQFEILFLAPLPEAIGVVEGWDRTLLEERALAGGGGRYTHYENGIITLDQILTNAEYSPPGCFWDNDVEDDIGR